MIINHRAFSIQPELSVTIFGVMKRLARSLVFWELKFYVLAGESGALLF